MRYKGRELRQLFEVEIYTGDWQDGDEETRTVTALAVNAVDAIRRVGSSNRAATQPKPLFHVTWPEPGQPASQIYRIDDTGGPAEDAERLEPDFMRREATE